jgi:hypothetical protein
MKAQELRIGNWIKLSDEYTSMDIIACDNAYANVTHIKDGNASTMDDYKKGLDYTILWKRSNPLGNNEPFTQATSGCGIELIEPIPLTEEWLLKFGFKYFSNTNGYTYRVDFRIHLVKVDIGFLLYLDREQWINIQHVHQLQNLYYALTAGKELTLNKTK